MSKDGAYQKVSLGNIKRWRVSVHERVSIRNPVIQNILMARNERRKCDDLSSPDDNLPTKKARRVLFYDCFLDIKGDKVIREVTGEKFGDLYHPYFAPPILGHSPISKMYVETYKERGGKKCDCIFKTMKELRRLRTTNVMLKEKYHEMTKERLNKISDDVNYAMFDDKAFRCDV
jgi:hypothetical protein